MRLVQLVVAGMACGGCLEAGEPLSTRPPPEGPPRIELDRPLVDVGGVEVASDAGPVVTTVFIRNTGGGEVELTRVQLTGRENAESFRLQNLTEVVLVEDEPAAFDISFDPERVGVLRQRVAVSSTDPARPEIFLDVVGTGLGGELHVEPTRPLSLAGVPVGCEGMAELRLSNLGTADLTIRSVEAVSTRTSVAATLDTADLPVTLAPRDAEVDGPITLVGLRVQPTEPGPFTIPLEVVSDDPMSPVTEVDVVGTAFATGDCTE